MDKKRVLIVVFGLLGLSIIFLLADNFTGYQIFSPYYGSNPTFGGGSGGAFSIIDLYLSYPTWFDFFLFLVVFIGLGQMVFKGKFEEGGGKVIYIGLGIILALALVLWEERSGFYILDVFGPYIFLLIILFIVLYLYRAIDDLTGVPVLAVSVAYLIFYAFFIGSFGYYGLGYSFFNFLYYLPFPLFAIMNVLAFVFLGLGIWGLIQLAQGVRKD